MVNTHRAGPAAYKALKPGLYGATNSTQAVISGCRVPRCYAKCGVPAATS